MNITFLAIGYDICGPCSTCNDVFFQTKLTSKGEYFDVTTYSTRNTNFKYMSTNNIVIP